MVSRSLQLVAAVACLSLLAACGGDNSDVDPAAAGPGGRLSIKMGTPSDTLSSSFYAFVAADKLGYWEDENLDVELVPGSGSGALVEQMVAGNLAAGAPSLPAVVEGLGAGLELIDIYTYSYGSIFGIWVPEDSPVKSVSDLKGKNIGVSEAGGGETAVLNSALKDVDIDPITEVNLIPIGQGEATTLDAIKRGRVDAYASSKNDGHSMTVSGLKLREITPPLYEGFPGRSIITTPKELKKNREQLVRMARGIAKGTLFCDNNVEACKKFMKEALPEQWVATNDAELSQGGLQYEEAVKTTSVPAGEQFGRHKADQMKAFKDTVASITKDFKDFDVNDFLVADILAEVNDFNRDEIIAEAKAYK